MARQGKALPARKPRDRSRDEDSVLLRSAETLGRVIGSLQRQLDGVTKRLSGTADDDDGIDVLRKRRDGSSDGTGNATGDGKATRKAPARARKTASASPGKSKRAAKSTAARKATGARKNTRRH